MKALQRYIKLSCASTLLIILRRRSLALTQHLATSLGRMILQCCLRLAILKLLSLLKKLFLSSRPHIGLSDAFVLVSAARQSSLKTLSSLPAPSCSHSSRTTVLQDARAQIASSFGLHFALARLYLGVQPSQCFVRLLQAMSSALACH